MLNAPTLEDVARAAGVSRATASRVVRGDVNVTGPKAESVRRAIHDLGYVPNKAARSLVTRSTDAIALIVPEPDARVFNDPFFATAVAAISSRLSTTDKQLMLVMTGRDGDPDRLRRFVRAGHADGLIVMSHREGDPALEAIAESTAPVVYIGRPPEGSDSLFVDSDNVEGGRIAARHLVDRGRRRLALITGPLRMAAAQDRREGFLEAARSLDASVVAVEEADFTLSGGEAATERLLRGAQPFDGVFVSNDLMAIGALRHLQAAGRRVPEDVALIGFDDIALAAEPINAITTIANPVPRLGAEATAMLLDIARGEPRAPLVFEDLVLHVRKTA